MDNDPRQARGMEIAAVCKVTRRDDGAWSVPSQSQNGRYVVRVGAAVADCHCSCPDHETRGVKCKHQWAVEFAMQRETHADGSTTVTESVRITATKRPTYPQNWPMYNAAQVNEKDHFRALLHELCRDLPSPEQKRGRPQFPVADAIFCAAFKVYSTVSARRFMCDLDDARESGYVARTPHFNTVLNCLEDAELTDVLTRLITISSLPLKAVEADFAIDSTGFTSSRFTRWYDHKYGCVRHDHDWVKAHFVCGVKTNVVTAVKILDRNAGDPPQLPSLLNTTVGAGFNVRELSADKAYASINNFNEIDRHGATPFIAFKSHHTGTSGGNFEKAFHYFNLNRPEFLAHYHKRSNVESTVSMVKAKFRDHVRSKTDAAMKNEVLCKFLCHNICCLISAIYELGIAPVFNLAGCTTSPMAAQLTA